MYLVTRTANLYMHGKWRNVPRSPPLGALPPVPVVHAVHCTRTHANAVRGQPVRRVVQAGELLPLRAECHAGQPPVGEAVRHLAPPKQQQHRAEQLLFAGGTSVALFSSSRSSYMQN